MESGEAKVGMEVNTTEGPGKVAKILGPDTVLVDLEGGAKFKTDVERIKPVVKK